MHTSDDGATMRPHKKRSRRELALNVGAIAGTICIVATVLSLMFGVKPLVFRSGSMSPAITTGSLALSRSVPVGDVKVGDVVSVVSPQGSRITHRVYRVQQLDGQTLVTLKGDANKQPDLLPYQVDTVNRVFFHVPFVGYLVAWLSSGIAIFLGGILAGALLMLAFGPMRRPGDETASGQKANSGNDIEPADPEVGDDSTHLTPLTEEPQHA